MMHAMRIGSCRYFSRGFTMKYAATTAYFMFLLCCRGTRTRARWWSPRRTSRRTGTLATSAPCSSPTACSAWAAPHACCPTGCGTPGAPSERLLPLPGVIRLFACEMKWLGACAQPRPPACTKGLQALRSLQHAATELSQEHVNLPSGDACRRYELSHVVRTHMGAQDVSYGCVFQREDAEGQARRHQPPMLIVC